MTNVGARLLAVLTVAVALAGACAGARVSATPLPPSNVTTYIIDLDLPPEQRWVQAVTDYKADLQALLAFLTDAIPAKYLASAETIAADLDFFLGELGQEIRGIATTSGFELGQITLLNFLYELTAFCTSILAVDSNGVLLHGRNLDYNLPTDLQRVTIQATFVSGGKTVFQGTTFVGYVGILSGMNGQFSATVDERDKGYAWENAFAAVFEGGKAVTFLIRELLQANATYTTAVDSLARTSLIAPCYVIVGGVGPMEAVIITRDRYEALNVSVISPAEGEWYEVVTNYDLNLPDPSNDPRRTAAQNSLNALGQSALAPASLLEVLATPPVDNAGTIYSIVASAQLGLYESWLR